MSAVPAPSPTTRDRAPADRLSGRLGPVAIIFIVVAAAAPMTVMAGSVPIGLLLGNGPAFPAMFAVAAVILALFAVGFTTMTPFVPQAGAFYSYVARGLGRAPGLGAAFLALVTYVGVQAAVFGFFGAAADDLITSLGGPDLPWYVWSLVALAVTSVLGYRHIDLSSKVLGVLLVGEIGVVLLMDLAVLANGGNGGFSSAAFSPSQIASGAPGIGLMFAIGGFLGFESTAVFRDEAARPERTIPRATYGALLVIGVFYTVSSWAMVSHWGDAGAVKEAGDNTATMLVDTAAATLGSAGADAVRVLLVTSIFACILSFHNVTARYVFTLGNEEVFPRGWGRSHHRHASPHVASLVVTAAGAAILVADVLFRLDPVTQVFAWFAGAATVGVIALMLLTCAAVLVFFARERVSAGAWRTKIAPGLGLVGLGACLYLTVANMTLLVGGSTALALTLDAVLAGSFVAGLVAARLRPAVPLPELADLTDLTDGTDGTDGTGRSAVGQARSES